MQNTHAVDLVLVLSSFQALEYSLPGEGNLSRKSVFKAITVSPLCPRWSWGEDMHFGCSPNPGKDVGWHESRTPPPVSPARQGDHRRNGAGTGPGHCTPHPGALQIAPSGEEILVWDALLLTRFGSFSKSLGFLSAKTRFRATWGCAS